MMDKGINSKIHSKPLFLVAYLDKTDMSIISAALREIPRVFIGVGQSIDCIYMCLNLFQETQTRNHCVGQNYMTGVFDRA